MKSPNQFGKIVSIISIAALAFLSNMAALANNPEPQFYTGTATLCAVDNPANVTTESRGNNGVTYTYNQVLLFYIATDHSLMNGWEVLTSNTKSTTSGGGYNWGEAVLTPDLGSGTLVDEFKFPVKQDDSIRGTYIGTGNYEGVTVDYALGPFMPLPSVCPDMPPQCTDGTYDCVPVPPGLGYYINGEVNPAD